MFELIAVVLAVFLAVYAVAAVVWLLQWLFAVPVWLFEVAVAPFFLYFLPAIVIVLALVGMAMGASSAGANYVRVVRKHTQPEEPLGQGFRSGVIAMVYVSLTATAMAALWVSVPQVIDNTVMFVASVDVYYSSVAYPPYRIHFPFWQ